MAETFKVGANARELLRYTQRATRIVTDDISRSDARKIIQKVAALEDVRDIQKVCGTAVHALDTRDREGFSKSTFRLYGEGIRLTARQILLDAHAANNVNFQTDYDKRVEKIGAVVALLAAVAVLGTGCGADAAGAVESRTRETRALGLLLSREDTFLSELKADIEAEAAAQGYAVRYYNAGNDPETQLRPVPQGGAVRGEHLLVVQ